MPAGLALSFEDFLQVRFSLFCQPVIGAVREDNDIRDKIRSLRYEFLDMDHSAVVGSGLERRMAAVAYSGEPVVSVVLRDSFRPDPSAPDRTSYRAVIEPAEPEGVPYPEGPAVPGCCDAVAEYRQSAAAELLRSGRCFKWPVTRRSLH